MKPGSTGSARLFFSPEEGTPAASMPRQVSSVTKKRRLERLMSHQEAISAERQSLFLGKTLDVLIDAVSEDGYAEGRSFREAPDVDGVIEIEDARGSLRPGDRIRATVTETYEHDMRAREAI
jgi:ribosomal protein S12 methylthiotransferase